MAKNRSVFRCSDCGASAPQWAGRCPGCGGWNSLVEERSVSSGAKGLTAAAVPIGTLETALPLSAIEVADVAPMATGSTEVDRVLGGGLVPGSVTLLGGEPGVGKSTLLLQLAARIARQGHQILVASGEESTRQIRLRADRLGAIDDRVLVVSETMIPNVIAQLDRHEPDVLIVDSIQTMFDPELSSAPGTVAQVRESAHRLVREAKARSLAVVLVGHVTKDGSLAGPRVLEHIVDTVLSFEGDRHHSLRLLRAVKHRFGATNELGVFEMTDAGLVAVPDASGIFLADRRSGIPGSVVVPALEGRRPLLVEIQALVSQSSLASPRRSVHGLDSGRVGLLLAVLERRCQLPTARNDVHALAVGGVKVIEPGADLAIPLALASSLLGLVVPEDVVACGEVGLGGEVRRVGRLDDRLAEAERLGFARAVVPVNAPDAPSGIEAIRIGTVQEALAALGLVDAESLSAG